MKVLYLLRAGRDATLDALISEHEAANDVNVVDLALEDDFERIMGLIEGADKVISW